MNKISLKQVVKNKINNIELSSSQLDSLMLLQESSLSNGANTSGEQLAARKYKNYFAAAAVVFLVFSVGFLFSISSTPVVDKITAEVSKNHLKLKPLEVNTDQLIVLNNYFTLLDFKLVSTDIMKDLNWTLLGARYCTIQGNTAAQLRLKNNKTGSIETLYQAPFYQEQFSDIPILENNQIPIEAFAHGIGVEVWVEKGVLFALTNSSTEY